MKRYEQGLYNGVNCHCFDQGRQKAIGTTSRNVPCKRIIEKKANRIKRCNVKN